MPKIRNNEIERPLCGCGNPVSYYGYTVKGFKKWKTACRNCEYLASQHKKDTCEKCGSTKNLQVDHIDRNRSNNNPDNLMTLCWPCHKIKTSENEEWKPRR